MPYELIIKLVQEAKELHERMNRLEEVIKQDPDVVPLEHKVLWQKQKNAMAEYLNILKQRIKMLAD